ncbi:AlkZ-related protein [Anaerocolumna xylanovorans]|uniref:Uncharacterized protein n=1 Tax=Anaerocolumna xylanovorans DSM 12503 TaxID=1121345 RepID=A0A1M7YKZ3_9FIRM|nr:hypothetical protein [Anaerocolumna xylanovorans]SHO53279.1 hypothetical protein SAMN02745217_04039 [Anaerocolumna xylanovorans DSM 12503]
MKKIKLVWQEYNIGMKGERYMLATIYNFQDFKENLYKAGMSTGGVNNEGVFSLCDYYGDTIQWHTEDADTDPWEWRMRVLNEETDIAYGKFFFKKSGYITREWYPYFYAVRRGDRELEEEYENGNISLFARKIYRLLTEYKELPLHLIKQYGGFSAEDKARFDAAMTELQMKFYITMCGRARKTSKAGEEYGWSSTVFCLTEDFFGKEIIKEALKIKPDDAYEKIYQWINRLNAGANPKKVSKFIKG